MVRIILFFCIIRFILYIITQYNNTNTSDKVIAKTFFIMFASIYSYFTVSNYTIINEKGQLK